MSITKVKTALRLKGNIFSILLLISLLWPLTGLAQPVSPETPKSYTAFVKNSEDKVRVDEPFFILLGLDPETLPSGYYLSTLVDIIESPDGVKPEILTGFPKIRLTMMQAGSYRFAVRVSLLSKSSCGGIDAQEILREEVKLQAVDQ
jgi:hypothetical protein